jgi:hypothetical protein
MTATRRLGQLIAPAIALQDRQLDPNDGVPGIPGFHRRTWFPAPGTAQWARLYSAEKGDGGQIEGSLLREEAPLLGSLS